MTAETGPAVRTAGPDDRLGVLRVLDAAVLEIDADALAARIDAGDVLVADSDGRVLGAAVLEPRETGAFVDAIAVRRARRGQGIGTALVEAASERYGRLTAEFDPGVRPFYDALGFDIAPAESDDDQRLTGVLAADS